MSLIPSGVSILFLWRATTKSLLHRVLPPFYRLLEQLRLDMPRRYFLRASYYSHFKCTLISDRIGPFLRYQINLFQGSKISPNFLLVLAGHGPYQWVRKAKSMSG